MNTKPQHTPEPWIVGNETRIYMGGAMEKREIAVATKADPSERSKAPANAHRIVACVNACAGMDDPATDVPEAMECVRLLGEAQNAEARLAAENARLREALKRIAQWDLKSGFDAPQLIAIARAALAKGEK